MSATATKPQPTAGQLKAYADQLPQIYRDVIRAFQDADPGRWSGDGVLGADLFAHLSELPHHPGQLRAALGKLEEAGFFEYRDVINAYLPTPVGEELVAVVTGKRAKPMTVPDLPKPTW